MFLVDADPAHPKTLRMRKMLGVNSGEDVWLEMTFYPSKIEMKKIIGQVWKHPRIADPMSQLDPIISKRKRGYEATLAYATLQSV